MEVLWRLAVDGVGILGNSHMHGKGRGRGRAYVYGGDT